MLEKSNPLFPSISPFDVRKIKVGDGHVLIWSNTEIRMGPLPSSYMEDPVVGVKVNKHEYLTQDDTE